MDEPDIKPSLIMREALKDEMRRKILERLEKRPLKLRERLQDARAGQAWVVRRDNKYYLKAVFRFDVELREPDDHILGVASTRTDVTVAWDGGAEIVKTGSAR